MGNETTDAADNWVEKRLNTRALTWEWETEDVIAAFIAGVEWARKEIALTADICPFCNESKSIRNPTGNCDHLYYPEYQNEHMKKEARKDGL